MTYGYSEIITHKKSLFMLEIDLYYSLMTYKCMKALAPPYLCNLFLTRSDVHDVNTRNKDMLHVPQYKTASGQRSFRYRAVKIWNTTDDNLKNLPFGTFKSKLKDKMLAETF